MSEALSGEIKSVAKFGAEKNLNTDPEIALGVKSILLQAKVGRADNPFGEASLNDLPPDEKYFIIGIIKTKTLTSLPFGQGSRGNPGDNEVELSSSNIPGLSFVFLIDNKKSNSLSKKTSCSYLIKKYK